MRREAKRHPWAAAPVVARAFAHYTEAAGGPPWAAPVRNSEGYMAQRPIRFGIAGLGTVSNTVLPELRDHPNVTIAAAADVRPEARERFTALYSVPAYASVEDLCASPDIDAVYVLTPNPFHATHATMAAERGKQVVVTKPIATTLADCDTMIAAAERHGVRLMAGTTPAFTPVIMEMAAIVQRGDLGRLLLVNTWWQTDWLYLPRMPEELDVNQGGGVVFRQAPHQIDIVRTIGGGMVRSVRARASRGDPDRPVEGGFMAFLEFENGAAAAMTYSGYAHLDTTEFTYGTDAQGMPRGPEKHLNTRRRASSFVGDRNKEATYKNSVRLGGIREGEWGGERPTKGHEFYGLTIVSCERGDLRQTANGLMIYGDEAWREVPLAVRGSEREAELDCLYEAWSADRPLPAHDGRWGKATLEVCLAILESSREHRDVVLRHQMPHTWTHQS